MYSKVLVLFVILCQNAMKNAYGEMLKPSKVLKMVNRVAAKEEASRIEQNGVHSHSCNTT